MNQPTYLESAARKTASEVEELLSTAETPFLGARQVVRRLGAHPTGAGSVCFGFWTPELLDEGVPEDEVYLDLLIPPEEVDLTAKAQELSFALHRLPTTRFGAYTWSVVENLPMGKRSSLGAFYSLVYFHGNEKRRIFDPLAYSVPFGAAAPAEVYDFAGMLRERRDHSYFRDLRMEPDPDGVDRVLGPANMLEVHIATASEEGTLAALTDRYRGIATKVEEGRALTPGERSFIGYDAVQPMPVEPTILYEADRSFWEERESNGTLEVKVRRPDTSNWGYDVITVASPSPNPTLLANGRPDELLEFITTLHTFPGKPIQVVFDVVYGHADNQSLPLLNSHYFAGANMYGQNLNYQNPTVRAILLEMQRRKSQYGVDGIRVDGAQDFKYWVANEDKLYHDDDYLSLMNDVVQEVGDRRYRPWMVFEDGRPWPRDDWELSSTYREVTKQLPNVVQWGPLTFAHNTPFLFTFWISKWWRIVELASVGSHWITGTSNHDTLRRGTQVDPEARINTYLGASLPEIFKQAYDNPATRLFDFVMPGIPMDFLNANSRAPWSFFRNTDDRYGVKVVSEEALFLDWAVEEARYLEPGVFPRIKKRGFKTSRDLKRFMRALDAAVRSTDYDLPAMAALLNAYDPPLREGDGFTVEELKRIATDWMDDVLDYCKVPQYEGELDDERSRYSLELRRARRERSWLVDNLREDEVFGRLEPTDGTVLFYALRRSPDGSEELLFVANMEGAPRRVTPVDLPIPGLAPTGWKLFFATPGMPPSKPEQSVQLRNGDGLLFRRDAI